MSPSSTSCPGRPWATTSSTRGAAAPLTTSGRPLTRTSRRVADHPSPGRPTTRCKKTADCTTAEPLRRAGGREGHDITAAMEAPRHARFQARTRSSWSSVGASRASRSPEASPRRFGAPLSSSGAPLRSPAAMAAAKPSSSVPRSLLAASIVGGLLRCLHHRQPRPARARQRRLPPRPRSGIRCSCLASQVTRRLGDPSAPLFGQLPSPPRPTSASNVGQVHPADTRGASGPAVTLLRPATPRSARRPTTLAASAWAVHRLRASCGKAH